MFRRIVNFILYGFEWIINSYTHNTNKLILYWYCKDKADIDKLSESKEPSP